MNNKATKYGLLAGIILVMVNLVLYAHHPRTMLNAGGYVGWGIHIFFIYLAGIALRNESSGQFPFQVAFKQGWTVFVVASLFEALFAYVMFCFVDPSLAQVTKDIMVEWAEWGTSMSGADQGKAIQDAKAIPLSDLELTPTKTLFSYAYRLLFPGAIFAAIVAAIIKREY